MRSRVIGIAVVVALAASGCSLFGSDGDGSHAKPARTVTAATGPAPHVEPCGPGTAHGATDTGVDDHTITIATIADVGGVRPNLFLGNWQATDAFVAYCNSVGGVNGRQLRLVKLDSALFDQRAQTILACDTSFALVGSAAALDGAGAQSGEDCGIPDVPAFSAQPQHASASNVVQPLPNPPDSYPVGPGRYLAQRYPDAVKHAAMLYSSVGVTLVQARRQMDSYTDVGFDFVDRVPFDVVSADFDSLVAKLHRPLGYVYVQGELTDLVSVEKALAAHGIKPTIVDAGQQFYDPALIRQGGAAVEGTYVLATTVPFSEASSSPEMQRYLHWLAVTHPGVQPTALGVQGWSAGLLFADALKSLGSNVTRAGLLDALRDVHHWDGNGIHIPTDPGANRQLGCFMYLQVRGGQFVRAFPSRGFSCSPDNVVASKSGTPS
jgi:ABC-type branched-subunit amino acid transport system substrate-binding protein